MFLDYNNKLKISQSLKKPTNNERNEILITLDINKKDINKDKKYKSQFNIFN